MKKGNITHRRRAFISCESITRSVGSTGACLKNRENLNELFSCPVHFSHLLSHPSNHKKRAMTLVRQELFDAVYSAEYTTTPSGTVHRVPYLIVMDKIAKKRNRTSQAALEALSGKAGELQLAEEERERVVHALQEAQLGHAELAAQLEEKTQQVVELERALHSARATAEASIKAMETKMKKMQEKLDTLQAVVKESEADAARLRQIKRVQEAVDERFKEVAFASELCLCVACMF